jgi:hypothetical protein
MLKNIVVAAALLIFSSAAHSESKLPKGIKCLFSMEAYPEGKSNQASCGMSPEIIFSSRYNKKPRNQHCDIGSTYSVNKYEDFFIDFKRNVISYNAVSYLSNYGKKQQKAYYIKKGHTEDAAKKKVESRRKDKIMKKIGEVFISQEALFVDPVTGEYLKKPKQQKIYNVFFEDKLFQMAEFVPQAIISYFATDKGNSWLNMKFGKCKILR